MVRTRIPPLKQRQEDRSNVTSQLQKRKEVEDDEEKEECEYCGKKYAKRGMIRQEIKAHEKLKCNICDEKFQTQKTLENHYAKKKLSTQLYSLNATFVSTRL